jgi:hypothetical protein
LVSSGTTDETQRMVLTPVLLGIGIAGAAITARIGLRAFQRFQGLPNAARASKFYRGGFDARMTKREAAQILSLAERTLTRAKIKEAHRKIMLANHPDRGGSPYLATKINEAKSFLDKTPGIRAYSSFARAR